MVYLNDEDITKAIYTLLNKNVSVINMSFGDTLCSDYFRKMINIAKYNNIALVASAGNSNINLDYFGHYPSNYSNVIAVGAKDFSGNHILNYGNKVTRYEIGYQVPYFYFDKHGRSQKITIYGSSASSIRYASELVRKSPHR